MQEIVVYILVALAVVYLWRRWALSGSCCSCEKGSTCGKASSTKLGTSCNTANAEARPPFRTDLTLEPKEKS